MKRVFIVVVLLIAAAVLGLWRSHGGVRAGLSKAVGITSNDSQARALSCNPARASRYSV